MNKGKVILVGAGPGDPGLLTVKAQQMLGAADVVVYDRLIGEEILEHAPQAKKIYVGKEQGKHPVPQDRINEILFEQACEHELVVRLKGGDPYIFGRGGEEADYLAERGVAVEEIPGVTSALAAPSYAGIPPTYRNLATSVHIITGHTAKSDQPEMDFEALARVGGTLIFLMSVASTPYIAAGLLANGLAADTSAALVEKGTLPQQRLVKGSLATIGELVKTEKVVSPAILIVGQVVDASEHLDWFAKRPLFGTTVVVTRPKKRAGTLAEKLRSLGAEVISLPCITSETLASEPVVNALENIVDYSWLVLTSPQGVESLFEILTTMKRDARIFAPVKIAAVGEATSKALLDHGLVADYMPKQYDAIHLAGGLVDQLTPEDRVLMLRAQKGTEVLPQKLGEKDVAFDDVPLYRTVPMTDDNPALAEKLTSGTIDYITFTSASTVEGFSAAYPNVSEGFTAVCIGEASQQAAAAAGYKTITAANATIDELVDTIKEDRHGPHH